MKLVYTIFFLDTRDYIIVCLLSNVLQSPILQITDKNNKRWKPSILESRESVVIFVNDMSDISSKLECLKRKYENLKNGINGKCLSLQPVVIVFGRDIFNLKKFVIHVDDVYFEAPTLLQAIRICFMLFYSLNLEYPVESLQTWQFFQKYFFNINYNKNIKLSTKVQSLITFLSNKNYIK